MTTQDRRIGIIQKVINSIKKAKDKEVLLDNDKFAAMICTENGCSMRTAKEYIKIASLMIK